MIFVQAGLIHTFYPITALFVHPCYCVTMPSIKLILVPHNIQDILLYVYKALQAKGYDPITQLVGYIISGDPTYITSYNSARSLICRLERDEILEELVRSYLDTH